MVEHDREVIENADQLLDFGPKAGEHGGEVVARGTPTVVGKNKNSVTGPYLSGRKAIAGADQPTRGQPAARGYDAQGQPRIVAGNDGRAGRAAAAGRRLD